MGYLVTDVSSLF